MQVRKRLSPSIVLFLVIVVAVAAWIGSGVVLRDPPAAPVVEERGPLRVATSLSEARSIERVLTLYGDIAPNQRISVRAETSGRIAKMLMERGARVRPGDALAQLAPGDREARLRRAQARLASAQRDFDAAEQLVKRDVAPEVRLRTAEADLAAALAEVETIRVEIEHTTVRAPIEGVINRIIAEVGDFVAVGGEVVEIVDNDPLVGVVQVPQHAVGRIQTGGTARVSMIGRDPIEGTIRLIAPLADPETRTFRVEVELPNPERQLPSGVSAEVILPTELVAAHHISPAIVSLNDRGQVGVFTVDRNNAVVFHEITLVRADPDGVWVSGLPESALLITARPGFVRDGQQVLPVEPDGPPSGRTPAQEN